MADDSSELLWNSSVTSKSWYEMIEEEYNEKVAEETPAVKSEPAESGNGEKEADNKVDEPLKNIAMTYSSILKGTDGDTTVTLKTEIKKEPVKDFLVEDISLTGHLDKFQLASPCKMEAPPAAKTPDNKRCLRDRVNIVATSTLGSPDTRAAKRKIQVDANAKTELTKDELLMPSPSKIPKQNTPRAAANKPSTPRSGSSNQTPKDLGNRKRQREITPHKGQSSEKRPPREIETDPDVLARRQKQIDYGKNTIGYDRYRQLVPKESRTAMHPRTPPMNLKFSRRAWDGLVKAWRQRLHFWDPPSDGGGNPALGSREGNFRRWALDNVKPSRYGRSFSNPTNPQDISCSKKYKCFIFPKELPIFTYSKSSNILKVKHSGDNEHVNVPRSACM